MASARGFIPAQIYLNGRLVDNVTEVDDIAGWVEVFKRGESGAYVLDDDCESLVREVLYGHVEYWPNGTY